MLPRLLLSAGIGFLAGVRYASFAPVSGAFLAGALLFAAAALISAPMLKKRSWVALALSAGIAAAVLGAVRFDAARLMPPPQLAQLADQKISIEGRVAAEPDARDASTRLAVAVDSIDGESARGGTMLVIAPAHAAVAYGDRIAASGKLKLPQPFESGTERIFDYPDYLAARGIVYEISYANVSVLSHGGNPLMRAVIALKALYLDGLHAVLPEPYAGLAAGITAGDKRSVGRELTDTFQRVSLVHILVLSGYNITVVLGACMRLLGRFSRAPKLAAVLGIVSFFVALSGGAPSAIRASAMAFAAVFAALYGRQFFAMRVLLLVCCAMVAWNPYVLAFDPGFQLSALATLGLVAYSAHFARLLRLLPASLREIAAATLSTQLTVLPLLLYENGTLSLVALPANMLALIAVPAAMTLSAIAALSGILFGTWGVLFALPALAFLKYIVTVAQLFAALPFAAVEVPAFGAALLAGAYALLLLLYMYWEYRNPPQMKTAGE